MPWLYARREIMCELRCSQILQVNMILNFLEATRASGTGPGEPLLSGNASSMSGAGPKIFGGSAAFSSLAPASSKPLCWHRRALFLRKSLGRTKAPRCRQRHLLEAKPEARQRFQAPSVGAPTYDGPALKDGSTARVTTRLPAMILAAPLVAAATAKAAISRRRTLTSIATRRPRSCLAPSLGLRAHSLAGGRTGTPPVAASALRIAAAMHDNTA
mmetsp:Transcript_104448/g.294408  ORF Transcript_104448/g.294408 Transcript_104448/m.294408 type:complete len:215 (+) Transcript_104448:484-1128(+)